VRNKKACAFCMNVAETEEWDSDRVIAWHCSLTGKKVEPTDKCEEFRHYDGEK
jgi:hypothetical protein